MPQKPSWLAMSYGGILRHIKKEWGVAMPRGEFCVVSPADPDPRWPDGYAAVLMGAGAREKTIPCCIVWVRRFFARFPGRRRRDLVRAEIETFLAETAAHPGVSNGQVQQARDSLELYYAKFRGIPLEPRGAISEASHPSQSSNESAHIQNTVGLYSKPNVRVTFQPQVMDEKWKKSQGGAAGGTAGTGATPPLLHPPLSG